MASILVSESRKLYFWNRTIFTEVLILEYVMRNVKCFIGVYALFAVVLVHALDLAKDELDKVIEDEITEKLSKDLLQSIERKFQVDLEKSVDMVLAKIKMLLQNGTILIQDKMIELQTLLDFIRKDGEVELDRCLQERQNETTALAEKALHQMVVCGYALIGYDPAQAVTRVMELKNMITEGIKPIYGEKKEINDLLKVCGHDHESLKKVIKCVISKSRVIKSAMMDITSKLIEGVVDLTKLMAHGAMHEACLIEVIKTTEDEAFELVKEVRNCTSGKERKDVLDKFLAENNATLLDITTPNENINEKDEAEENKDKTENLQDTSGLLRRMMNDNKSSDLDKQLKKKYITLAKNLVTDYDNNRLN